MAKTPRGIAVKPVRAYVTRRGKLINPYYRAPHGLRRALGKRA
jgi:hypothetical protein